MKVCIWKIPFGWLTFGYTMKFTIEEKGYIELDKFDRQECWHLCNWSCWADGEKPDNLHSDLDCANSDVIFLDPITGVYHLALSFGWEEFKSLEDTINYCIKIHEE